MKAKLIVEGKEFDIEISDPKLQELVAPKKQTGYERVTKGENYYVNDYYADKVCRKTEQILPMNDERYESANYYSSITIAEANARADRLMRQLRRFAVEHRKKELDWDDNNTQDKWVIVYSSGDGLFAFPHRFRQCHGAIYFDRKDDVRSAIDTFHDELIWYFTEYKDSL